MLQIAEEQEKAGRRRGLAPREPGRWTLGGLARASGGRLARGDPGSGAHGVSTDTRALARGQAFVALEGERFDGHDFLGEAGAAGAAVTIVNESRAAEAVERTGTLPVIAVPDTGRALLALAAHERSCSTIEWIGVTGSAGKTTTKELTAAAIGALGPVLKAPASFNNRVGVPLTILGLRPEHRAAVIELGTGGPGEMRELAGAARPTVGIVTGIGPAHLARFGTLDAVAREKAGMLRVLPADGVAVLPRACEHYRILRSSTPAIVLTFGLGRRADFRAEDVEVGRDGTSRFTVAGVEVRLNLPGRVNVLNALAAMAAARAAGVSAGDAAAGLARVRPLPLRGRLREKNGVRVVEDCYNANPMSFAAALENLALARRRSRVWVVAGDMCELGGASARFHRELGGEIARTGAERVLAVGEFAQEVVEGARKAGLSGHVLETFATAAEAAPRAGRLVRAGDLVLVKGSRKMGLEVVTGALLRSRADEGRSDDGARRAAAG